MQVLYLGPLVIDYSRLFTSEASRFKLKFLCMTYYFNTACFLRCFFNKCYLKLNLHFRVRYNIDIHLRENSILFYPCSFIFSLIGWRLNKRVWLWYQRSVLSDHCKLIIKQYRFLTIYRDIPEHNASQQMLLRISGESNLQWRIQTFR